MRMARLKIKLGDSEFEAEGTPEDIQAQYAAFLEAIKNTGAKPKAPKEPAASPESLDDTALGRIFEAAPDSTLVTLKILPKGENRDADAMLLLLYGYRMFRQEHTVLGTQLMKAAEQSGLPGFRPSWVAPVHEVYLIRGGQKKGSTYGLNNQGLIKAKEIAAKMFD
jgi:hypothetical protein